MWHHKSALYKDLSYFNEKEAAGSLPNFTVNDIKIIYVNCVWRNEYGSDARSYEHYLRPEKNSVSYGIWTHDLCDTGAALY